MRISLEEIKKRIAKENGLQSCRPSFSANSKINVMELLAQIMSKYPDTVAEIEENIADGEDFRIHFSDEDCLDEFGKLRYSDPEKFYRILRKEEQFLNTCLQTFGFVNYIVSLDPDKLFGNSQL